MDNDATVEAAIAFLSQVYIVDDDKSFGKSMKRLLRAEGFSAYYFESAESFLSSVPPDRHGYVIVDIHMPECDGLCLMDKMHALHYNMPVIVVTGRPPDDAADAVLKKGAVGLLLKPFSEKSLLELLNKAEC